MNLTSFRGKPSDCTEAQNFVDAKLGPYIINDTAAAELCSRHLCQDNG
ncbi:hyaluronidase-4 [Columba livia]|uniref:Hyaluronidase-4 n=1 Tax=Columba livia TaxID=8932 RepID=A0A2I0MK07_COLLI|nr:hyaluronidase-4 [Columba livia]